MCSLVISVTLIIYIVSGGSTKVKVNFKKAISLRNNYPKAYNNLGIVFHEEKNLDEAIFNYKRALAIKRDYPEAYFNLGNALLDLENFEEAIEMFKKSLLLRPNYFGAHVNMVFAFKNVTIKKLTLAFNLIFWNY